MMAKLRNCSRECNKLIFSNENKCGKLINEKSFTRTQTGNKIFFPPFPHLVSVLNFPREPSSRSRSLIESESIRRDISPTIDVDSRFRKIRLFFLPTFCKNPGDHGTIDRKSSSLRVAAAITAAATSVFADTRNRP